MLSFIDQIDVYNSNQLTIGLDKTAADEQHNKLKRKEAVYRNFLLYDQFFAAIKPVILCEGSTDSVYLVHAIRRLAENLPILATTKPSGDVEINVRLYRYFRRRPKKKSADHSKNTSSTSRILGIKGGSGDLVNFAATYYKHQKNINAPGANQPVILLIDNDSGADSMFKYIKSITQKTNKLKNEPFIHLFRNLYVVPTPLIQDQHESTIEDFFDEKIRNELVGGLPFNPNKKHEDHTSYGKVIFAHSVVRPNADKIDFSNFKQLLINIASAIAAHRSTRAMPD